MTRFAIVIGNNSPTRSNKLRFADDDAVAMHQLLRDAGVESVLLTRLDVESAALHREVVPDGLPSRVALTAATSRVFKKIRAAAKGGIKTELLLVYSGHGDVERGEGYVELEDDRLTRSRLFRILHASPARRTHVIVDACKSHYLAYGKRPDNDKRRPFRRRLDRALVSSETKGLRQKVGFVLSTSSGRDSHEYERYQAGVFSYEVRSALRGAADVDRDGRVTYAELQAFLAVANRGILNAKFRPDFNVVPPGQDRGHALIGWPSRSRTLTLDSDAIGHVYFETGRGVQLLDVNAARGQSLDIHVGARPLFIRRRDESFEYTIEHESDEPVRVAALTPKPLAVGTRGAFERALESLFTIPFGHLDFLAFERDTAILETSRRARANSSYTWRDVRSVAAPIAMGAAAGGLALSALALTRDPPQSGESQVVIESRNQQIRRLNVASIVCYSTAVVGGVVWGSTLLLDSNVSNAEHAMSIRVQARF